MTITLIVAVLLFWLALGGITAILVCPLLKQKHSNTPPWDADGATLRKSAVRSVSQTSTTSHSTSLPQPKPNQPV
jgi:hypothetical protein